MLSNSLNTQGAMPKKTSILSGSSNPYSTVSLGSQTQTLQTQPKTSGMINLGQSISTPALKQTQISMGNNPGMIKSKTDVSGNTINYDTKPNPSILEQQKSLNKLGAGLVEDGIIGDKTREAIAYYGNNSSSAQPDYDATTGLLTSAGKAKGLPEVNAQKNIPVEKPPAALTVSGQIPGLLQSGQQTENEKSTQTNLQNSGQVTDWEKAARNSPEVQQAISALADFRQKASQEFGDISSSGIPLEFQQGRKQALALQYAQQESALQSAVTNALTAQGQQLSAAGTQAGRGLSSAQSAYSGAQTQANRATGVAGTALGAVAPITGLPYGTRDVQPGLLGTTSGISDSSGLLKGGAAGLIPQYYNEYNQAQTNLDAISKNEQLFNNLLSTAKVNPTDLTPINDLLQKVGQLTSSSDYANFQNLISSLRSNYTQLLASRGMTPSEAGAKANSLIPDNASIATINSVMQTLKQEGQNYLSSKADQLKRAEETFKTGTAPNTATPTTSASGGIITTPSGLVINPNF